MIFLTYLMSFDSFRDQFTIVPILVGSLTPEREVHYGRLLAPYLADPQVMLKVVSWVNVWW